MLSKLLGNDAYTPYRRWVLLGIVANIGLCLMAGAALDFFTGLFMLPTVPAEMKVWPWFACVLLMLLSFYYVTAIRNPTDKYAVNMTFISRLAGVLYFGLVVAPNFGISYVIFAAYDGFFGLMAFLAYRKAIGNLQDNITA